MKKFYSIVLMATALLIGTNVWAETHVAQIVGGGTYSTLNQAFAEVQDGQTIQMLENCSLTAAIDFGKATKASEYNPKTVTLDFKGKTVNMEGYSRMFNVYSGTLKLENTNSSEGGGLHHTYNSGKYYTILVFGSIRKDCDPSDDKANYYTHLVIGEGVNIVSDGEKTTNGGICVMIMPNGTNKVTQTNKLVITASTAPQTEGGAANLANSNIWNGYTTCGSYIYTNDYNYDSSKAYTKQYTFTDPRGVANGVRIDVYGHLEGSLYAMQSNGQLAGPDDKYKEAGSYYNTYKNTFYGDKIPAEVADISDNDKKYAPYIHIYPEAVLTNTESVGESLKAKQVALYTSGYARWYVEGECSGTTGLYMKSGDVTLKDATISSSFTGTATNNSGQTIGVSGQGNAVVVESNDHYSGHLSLTIEGDTKVETPADGGTALLETIASGSNPEVEHIDINGGTLTGENAIVISQETAGENVVTVAGSNLEGAVDPSTLTDIIANGSHATTVGNTVIISSGDAPTSENTGSWNTIKGKEGQNVNWNVVENASIAENETVTLGELQIISGTAGNLQQLTIANGATLNVDRLIMNDYARIIVEAGGKLIVSGTQGINAPVAENIVLKASQDAQAIFLFNPAVTSNKHPNATVEFISKSWRKTDGSAMAWQRFGIPSFGALTEITATAPTAFARFNKETNEWESIGILGTMDLSKMATPFEYYQMLNNTPDMGTVVTMKGQLYGNESPELAIRGNFWNGFSNSYMAPINGSQLLNLIPSTVDKAFYLNKIDGNQASWESVTSLNIIMGLMDDIKPMQPFLIRNTKEAADVTVDYTAAVYNPAMGIVPNSAPARRDENLTFVKIGVQGAEGFDRILVAEGADFSAEFDNGYDAVKFMNEDINLYVSADEKMGNFATNDLNNTYVGLQTVKGGNYTIEFANVQGAELTLIDHETGAQVAMVEGATYEFTAAANSVNDYRFEIVSAAKMPTAIENAEAVKSAKGIYTITGQYVGEMNVWNTLPAGIYVVNGEKLVK